MQPFEEVFTGTGVPLYQDWLTAAGDQVRAKEAERNEALRDRIYDVFQDVDSVVFDMFRGGWPERTGRRA